MMTVYSLRRWNGKPLSATFEVLYSVAIRLALLLEHKAFALQNL